MKTNLIRADFYLNRQFRIRFLIHHIVFSMNLYDFPNLLFLDQILFLIDHNLIFGIIKFYNFTWHYYVYPLNQYIFYYYLLFYSYTFLFILYFIMFQVRIFLLLYLNSPFIKLHIHFLTYLIILL